jgi:hypothetical protein
VLAHQLHREVHLLGAPAGKVWRTIPTKVIGVGVSE